MFKTDHQGMRATLIGNQAKGLRTMVKSKYPAPALVRRAELQLHHPVHNPPLPVPPVGDAGPHSLRPIRLIHINDLFSAECIWDPGAAESLVSFGLSGS